MGGAGSVAQSRILTVEDTRDDAWQYAYSYMVEDVKAGVVKITYGEDGEVKEIELRMER